MTPHAVSADRRQPAARQLPAVPVRRLHHLAVRDLPVARPRSNDMAIHSSPKSASSRSTSRPRAGRSATGSSCRSRRTRRCSRCSGTTYGGDGKSNFALPDLQGSAPMHPGPGTRPRRCTTSGETGGSETVTLLGVGDPVALARPDRAVPRDRPTPIACQLAAIARVDRRAALSGRRRERRWRP